MAELEIAMITLSGNYSQNWKWFVDDTFATFVLPDKIGYIVNELNSFNETIQFTLEIEENKLACLDIIEIRNSNDTINTQVYRKPTNKRHLH